MQHQRIPGWTSIVLTCLLACGDDDSGDTSVEAYCGRICASREEADCPRDPGDCDEACADKYEKVLQKCEDEREELLKCASQAEYTCDENRKSQATSCTAKESAFLRCTGDGGASLSDSGTTTSDAGRPDAGSSDGGRDAGADGGADAGPSDDFVSLCADYCVEAVASGCTAEGTIPECNANCVDAAASELTECRPEFADLLTCLSSASFTCNVDNYAATEDCNPSFAALDTCQTAGSTAQCTPVSSDTCDVCVATLCCAEFTACDADCDAYFACTAACLDGDTACLSQCDTNAPLQASAAASALVECALTSCSATCS